MGKPGPHAPGQSGVVTVRELPSDIRRKQHHERCAQHQDGVGKRLPCTCVILRTAGTRA